MADAVGVAGASGSMVVVALMVLLLEIGPGVVAPVTSTVDPKHFQRRRVTDPSDG
jgi:hypothetical protein